MGSALIGFRSPSPDTTRFFCTDKTIRQVNQITRGAKLTDHIKLSCLPNIWSPTYKNLQGSYMSSTRSSYYTVPMLSLRSYHSEKLIPTNEEDLVLAEPARFPDSKGDYYDVEPQSRFYVIKSFSELDNHASKAHGIWTSTELGNQRLDTAYNEAPNASIFLFFLVNGSGQFCGVARMTGPIDFTRTSDIWVEASRWKATFPLEWLLVKDIPNAVFRYLKVPTNSNKCVTYSRDTQEIPYDVGIAMLKIFTSFRHLG